MTPDITTIKNDLLKLPIEIYEKETAVVEAQDALDRAINTYGVALAKEEIVQFAGARMEKRTMQEAKSIAFEKTAMKELDVIAARTALNRAKTELKKLENTFVAIRRISNLLELEHKFNSMNV